MDHHKEAILIYRDGTRMFADVANVRDRKGKLPKIITTHGRPLVREIGSNIELLTGRAVYLETEMFSIVSKLIPVTDDEAALDESPVF